MTTRSIPTEILTQHVAVLGKTGSGKTSTAKLLIEQVVADGARVCVLDPIKSDWWGLTSSRDGKKAGLPFHILGGPRGHVPLHASAGKVIGEIVANGALPLSIIDMADFEPGGQAKFFTEFAPTLLRKMRGVVYLVIEEAHLFAPKERSGIGAENLSIHWAKTLATAGRSKGVRLVLVTQRTQALHNALLGSCDTMIAHRLTAPADQEPVIKWLKANTSKEVLEQVTGSLASLKTGDAWLCSGEAKRFEIVHFPRIATYDNTATPTGDGDTREIKTAAVDQDKLRAIIGDAAEKAKQDDPRELRKEIARLRGEIAKVPGAAVITPRTIEKAILTNADRALLDKLAAAIEASVRLSSETLGAAESRAELRMQSAVADYLNTTRNVALDVAHELEKVLGRVGVQKVLGKLSAVSSQPSTTNTHAPIATGSRTTPAASQGRRVAPAAATSRPASLPPSRAGAPSAVGGESLPPAKQKILNALAWLATVGLTAADRQVVAFVASTSSKSSAYENNVSALRTAGYLDYPGPNRLRLTAAGAERAVAPEAPLTAADLHQQVQALVAPAQWRIVKAAIDAYPTALSREDLAERASTSAASSAFENNVSRMRSLGLLDYPQQGYVVATPLLFLEAA